MDLMMQKIEKDIVVRNKQGLHARPAAMFVQIASKYDATVTVQKGKEKVNGKSIMGILMLGAQNNCTVKVIVEGDDAQAAIDELTNFLSQNE